jgi:predicted enzyme related to lactoylglutathione lyase
VIKENETVPDMGAFSLITDPTGATIGLWETRSKPS